MQDPISETLVAQIQKVKKHGGRIIAVGTTSVRALEAMAASGPLRACCDSTALFIKPGFEFKIIDGMITNFHLPRSTLLLLVSALMGLDFLHQAYQLAISQHYRFYSYGDAMLIL